MRVTMLIYDLGCGGAERVQSAMANFWAAKGWSVTLMTVTGSSKPDFYELHPAVCRRSLGIASDSYSPVTAMLKNAARLRVLRRTIRESAPDAVISFQIHENVLAILSCLGMRVPVLVSERIDPSHEQAGWTWDFLRRMVYPLASRVVVQTESVRAYFGNTVRRKILVIPNPVRRLGCTTGASGPSYGVGTRTLIAAGRLVPQKGFDLLIRAFADVAREYPDWKLVICGQGPMRGELESLRDGLGLSGRVFLPGISKVLETEFSDADLFVLSSRFEGFPNVLCEAMSVGLPAVSFDCPNGPRDVVRDGLDGLLVPPEDVPALAAALGRLMGDEAERRLMSTRAPEVAERFSAERAMGLWEEAIHGAMNGGPVP